MNLIKPDFKHYIIFFAIVLILPSSSYSQNIQMDIHGFISQGYLKSDSGDFMAKTEEGTFDFNECGINFISNINKKFHLGIQFFSRDFGDFDNNTINIDWAYGDYRYRDYLGFRIGQVKIPYGLYNEIRDIDFLRTSILLPISIYKESWRDSLTSIKGFGFYGDIPLNKLGDLSYQCIYGQPKLPPDGGISNLVENYGNFDVKEIIADDLFAVQVTWDTFLQGLLLRTTFASTTFDGLYQSNDLFAWGDIRLSMDIQNQLPGQLEPILMSKINEKSLSKSLTDQYIKLLTPDSMKSLNSSWPKEFSDEYESVTFLLYSLKYQNNNFTLESEYEFLRLKSSRTLLENNQLLHNDVQNHIGFYVNTSYRFTDWLEIGCYYSVTYYDEDDKSGDYFASLNNRDSFKYPVLLRYNGTSQEIQQSFKQYANQAFSKIAPGIQLTDEDIKNIQLIPNYTLENVNFHDYCAWLKDFVISVRMDINENWIVKLEGHFMDGIYLMDFSDNLGNTSPKRFLFATKVTYSF